MRWIQIRRVLVIQLIYLAMAALWNLAGVALIAQGLRAPGPTASLAVAAYLLALGAVTYVGARRIRWIYLGGTLLAGVGAASAIVQAFQLDPSLWPSSFWRYAGVLLNGFGLFGAVWGCLVGLKSGPSPARDAAL